MGSGAEGVEYCFWWYFWWCCLVWVDCYIVWLIGSLVACCGADLFFGCVVVSYGVGQGQLLVIP